MNFEGKRILMFSPSFFGYEKKIKLKMEQLGAMVDLYDTRPSNSAVFRAIIKINPVLFKNKCDSYYSNIISKNKENIYDYILIIKCDLVSKKILQSLKTTFSTAKMCLYLWDSLKDIPWIRNKLDFFDVINSFDDADCKEDNRLGFRPLFFTDEYVHKENKSQFKYDLSFCGTVHTDRYKIIRKIKEQCDEVHLRFFTFLYLQSKFIYSFYKLTKKEFKDVDKEAFSFEKKTSDEIKRIVEDSNCILDIESPGQKGMTMRTIEILGMKKKLITTNTRIKKYDFYDPQNVLIIKRNNPKINSDFFTRPYKNIDESVYHKYSLTEWVTDVFDTCNRFQIDPK